MRARAAGLNTFDMIRCHMRMRSERLIEKTWPESLDMDSFDLQTELERHHAESFAWALTCCEFDPNQAEDLLQLVYLKILRSQAAFRGKSSWKTWLFAVIRRTAANERRRQFLRRVLLLKWGESTGPVVPERQRQVLHLVFYQDLTIEEAAHVMRLSAGSARTHYERAKARVRTLLANLERTYERRGTQSEISPGIQSC